MNDAAAHTATALDLRPLDLITQPALIRGACSAASRDGAVHLQRFPQPLWDFYAAVEASRLRAGCTAGVQIAFASDSRIVRLRLRYGLAVPWTKQFGFDLLVNDVLAAEHGPGAADEGTRWEGPIFTAQTREMRRFVLHLPHLAAVAIEAVEVERSSTVEPLPAPPKTCLALGDSITQGYVTAHPSRCFAAVAAAELGLQLHNLAVGGAVAEPVLAHAAQVIPAQLILVAYGINDYAQHCPGDTFRGHARALLQGLRQHQPDSRIVWITPIPYHGKMDTANNVGLTPRHYSGILEQEVAAIAGAAAINGETLLPDEAGCFVDNVHPDGPNHELYGRNLARALAPLLA